MRINLRAKIHGYTFFIMLAKTQSLSGITSKVVGDEFKRHYVFWDLEQCTLGQAKLALKYVQEQYDLGTIFVTSDFPHSFRAWCFSKVAFLTLIRILIDTAFVDYNFIYWTMQKGKATLRLSPKQNRPEQKLVAVFSRDYEEEWQNLEEKRKREMFLPNQFEQVNYETGYDKIGIFKKFDFDKNISEER